MTLVSQKGAFIDVPDRSGTPAPGFAPLGLGEWGVTWEGATMNPWIPSNAGVSRIEPEERSLAFWSRWAVAGSISHFRLINYNSPRNLGAACLLSSTEPPVHQRVPS